MMVKPKIIYLMCLTLIGIALSLPIQAAIIYQHNFSELSLILGKISLSNWLTIAALLTTTYFLFQVSPLIKICAPITILILAWNNYIVGQFGEDYSVAQGLTGTILFCFIFTPLFHKNVRLFLNNPKNRWWTRARRIHKNVDVVLNPYVGHTLQAKTFDVSETGAFIPFENLAWTEIPKVGERIKICLHVGTLRKIKCEAIVVRAEEPKGIYPKGIGVRFTEIDSDHRKGLNHFLNH